MEEEKFKTLKRKPQEVEEREDAVISMSNCFWIYQILKKTKAKLNNKNIYIAWVELPREKQILETNHG